MKRIGAVIQARIGSQRLPGKVLKDIAGKTMLERVVERVRLSKMIGTIIIATSINPQDDIIVALAGKMQIDWHRGSEKDVLARYLEAAKKFELDVIVRVTADNPFTDPVVMDQVIEHHMESGVDYTANCRFVQSFPRGCEVEVVSMDCLSKIAELAKNKMDREHVTLYIYENLDYFTTRFVEASGPLRRPDLRLAVDTEEDLKLAVAIYSSLSHVQEGFQLSHIIELLDQNPELKMINSGIEQKVVIPGKNY